MDKRHILVSETQLLAIRTFFNSHTEDMLYGGAARGGKSEAIGIILAICISAFPGSSWLISRTQLADLKATTLSTFFKVIKRFGFGEKSYRDKIRDERHLLFDNGSKLFVIQVNHEPGDPEFDRIGSYGYTGGFLDEGQQMSNKVREVLQGRLSELTGEFTTEVPFRYKDYNTKQLNPGYKITFKIVIETKKHKHELTTPESKIHELVTDNGRVCVITREEELFIPYRLIHSQDNGNKLFHTYAWDFKGCIFTGCNPGTNFTRTEFYKPSRTGSLPLYMKFIPAKVGDNPWVDQKYIERLERLPETSIRKQRLLYGNFDYDDNPGILFDSNTLEEVFVRKVEKNEVINKFLTIDTARQGKDKIEIGRREDLHLVEIIRFNKEKDLQLKDLTKQAEKIEQIANKYDIDIQNNIIVDEVGVGGGLVDMLGCKGFVGNSAPLHPYASKYLSYKKRNYANLRTQAFYYLQKYINKIIISCDQDTKDEIIEELLTIKEKDVDNDSKLQIIPKSDIKEELGHSPDLADMISMRMWFIIKDHHLNPQTEEEEEDNIKDDEQTKFAKYVESFDNNKEEEFDFDIYD